jgi:hypothetical protein
MRNPSRVTDGDVFGLSKREGNKMRSAISEVIGERLRFRRDSKFCVLRGMFVGMLTLCLHRTALADADLKQYETKYYTIYTDISPDDEKEAAARMTRMVEEYHARTKDFSGTIKTRLPFYLFKSEKDYFAAGGPRGSAGVFKVDADGARLMGVAGQHLTRETWHVVQHEGFHQFAHAVIGGKMPTWLDEGLAEYFGESIFTGDGFVTGIIPPYREQRLKDEISGDQLKSFKQMMLISPEQWRAEINILNYDQAWSMVHYFVAGDDGKYQVAFSQCIKGISAGKSFNSAWLETLGSADGFEPRWKDWWMHQPQSPTRLLYLRAAVATVTSYVARAYVARQTFSTFDDFKSAVDSDSLKNLPDNWVPPRLIKDTIRLYGDLPNWQISAAANQHPIVSLTLFDGTRATGTFTLSGTTIEQVNVDIDDLAKVLKEARVLLDAGQKDQARKLVVDSLKDHLQSPQAIDAKQFLQEIH